MFGRKKKLIPRWVLQLFREGDRYWYAWLPLNEEGKITPINAKRHDYYISCFGCMEHTEHHSFIGDYTYAGKISEEELREYIIKDGCELVGELPESIGYDGLWLEKASEKEKCGV